MAVRKVQTWEQNYVRKNPNTQPKEKVHKKGWVTKGEKILYVFFTSVFLLAASFLVTFSSTTDTLNRDVQTLENKVDDQKIKIEALEFEKKELQRPERIIQKAKENGLNIKNSKVKSVDVFKK
ncbi:cell division protein FtsL [Cerasibacillus terrae]|uniref:Cell division protein FtsL n=1 Tax=Cerasibacillus terrae TaxID=2498845 RepID=A0A5C8P363_9BACI|nr:cell division protein FtsL [Cerasibacillus terrae]TXL67593.1 cell division protein FtsL [Cerasibacillus terrae]